jgi:hypothetical protein
VRRRPPASQTIITKPKANSTYRAGNPNSWRCGIEVGQFVR